MFAVYSLRQTRPDLLLEPESQVTAPLRWYLHERHKAIFYGAYPPAVLRQGSDSAWTVTCAAPKIDLGATLARETGMEAKLWLKRDLPPARKGDAPTQFEIIHLVR